MNFISLELHFLYEETAMNEASSAANQRFNSFSIVSHMAQGDPLHLYSEGQLDYKRTADLIKLSKTDLRKIAGIAKSSVRFDSHIPEPVALRLRELANIANLVAEYFSGDAIKVGCGSNLQTRCWEIYRRGP